jgi:hypothetical protein
MFIPDPDFYPSRIPDRIPDPKTATKERGEKKLDVKPFYVATKFNKIVNYFSFEVLKKPIPDPGSRGQKGTGSRIRIRNTVYHTTTIR